MPKSNYPHGFSNGVTIRQVPVLDIQNGLGNVFWVDSVKGSDGNKGTFKFPFATLDYAISRCKANQGDKLFVAAGHIETIEDATSLIADIDGIQIFGMGTGDDRPTITFATDTAASWVINSDDVYIANMRFICNIASQVTVLDCNAKRTIVERCSFEEGSATGLTFVDINGGGVNVCDGVELINCDFNAPTAGNYTTAVELGEVADKVKVVGCTAFGDFDDACIHNPTGKVLTNLTIADCTLTNNQAGIHAIELVSACTGIGKHNYMYTDTYATTIDPGALKCFECYSVNEVDKNGILNPVAQT